MNDRQAGRGEMRTSLQTGRLRLDAFCLDDAAQLHELFGDPRTHTIGDGAFGDVRETEAWIERRIATRRKAGLCWYGLRVRTSGRLVGNCGIFPGRTGIVEPEIGYEIRSEARGVGYASEAASAVIGECARVALPRVWATVRPGNAASLRVLERIGMVFDRREEDAKGALLYLSRVP